MLNNIAIVKILKCYHFDFSSKIKVILLVLLCMADALPIALGVHLFSIGPSFTNTFETYKSFSLKLKLCFAFATAELSNFKTGSADFLLIKPRLVLASLTAMPLITSMTNLTFLGATLKFFKCA